MSLVAAAISPAQPARPGPIVVTFRVARQIYALPLAAVLQVVRLPALTLVPDAPRGHCGLLNLRGSFLPVLDARALLGEPAAASLESHVLVLSAGALDGAAALGLLVDAVDTVRRFPPGSFAPIGGAGQIVTGILREREEAAVVLDPEALASRAAG